MKTTSMSVLVFMAMSMWMEVSAAPIPSEVQHVQEKLTNEVKTLTLSDAEEKALEQAALELIKRDGVVDGSQFFLLVNRNQDGQTASLAFYDHLRNGVTILGTTKVSTGNPKRKGSFETPIGIFQNTPANMSYRALGTRNTKGWRGLGEKGSRVWDLGWQKTAHPGGGTIEIRPLVHATDPKFGEPRLGKRDSQGCIRVQADFNRFLDHYGILDAEYEKRQKAQYVLPKNREPVSYAGSYVVVVDDVR